MTALLLSPVYKFISEGVFSPETKKSDIISNDCLYLHHTVLGREYFLYILLNFSAIISQLNRSTAIFLADTPIFFLRVSLSRSLLTFWTISLEFLDLTK